jgi:GPI ethanolamine phosphate transferase 1
MMNIQVVDTIVKQTETLFSEFYGDNETAFVFTADHGMSVIGNHGDGGEYYIALQVADCTNDAML